MADNHQLLAEYAKNGSETAFRELVERYVDLVYSAAVRLVNGDGHLAEDVAQTVFADLARLARTLSKDVMLGGWLHRHTCFVASKTMRGERRRQLRERQAVEMNSIEDHSAANFASLAPILDDAINQLGAEDRKAIVLRFFEQRDFRAVGEAMSSNEEAARKRVDRALEKLHLLLKRRGLAYPAAALAATLGAQAVSAAPAGMAAGIVAGALASAAAGGSTMLTILNIMSMTKVQVGAIAALVVAVAVPFAIQYRAQNKLRQENTALRLQLAQLDELAAENKRLSTVVAPSAPAAPTPTNDQFRELLKLRGEVGRLRQETTKPRPSALSEIAASPEITKMIRDQQKMAMNMVYKDFAKRANLPKDLADKLDDLHADNIMENVGHVTAVLRDAKTPEERDRLFAQQETALQEKVQALLGPEGFAQYQEYTRNLLSHLTAEQFKAMLTGDKAKKDDQAKQLFQVLQEERQAALASAGLEPDFQAIPNLNFRNMASEEEGEKNLKLLDTIYERATARATSFLNADEIQKFTEFRTNAININRMSLVMNRKMMAPAAK